MNRSVLKTKINNSGAALVTVVIVIAFVSILVTTVLYMAGMNYYAKGADRETKESFYEAEIPMEKIKAALMVECKTAHQEAFEATLPTFAMAGEAERRACYYDAFTAEIQKQIGKHIHDNGTFKGYLESVVGTEYKNDLTFTGTQLDDSEIEDGRLYIRNVTITHVKDGYQTQITTDFCIQAPNISWGADSVPVGFSGTIEAEELVRKKFDMSDCVLYYSWEKE
ncbi:MAG: hypothetical protein II994_10030 [Lachnospiraceae bacterium]|nr:hypothetical protein [Lachnospiraceae bacterium]